MSESHKSFPQLAFILLLCVIVVLLAVVGLLMRKSYGDHTANTSEQLMRSASFQPTPKVVKIPDNFPKDVPLYSGSRVTSSLESDQLGSHIDAWLTLETTDAAEIVAVNYTKILADNGWLYNSTRKIPLGTTITVTKGGKQTTVSIESSKTKNLTNILIIVEPEVVVPR